MPRSLAITSVSSLRMRGREPLPSGVWLPNQCIFCTHSHLECRGVLYCYLSPGSNPVHLKCTEGFASHLPKVGDVSSAICLLANQCILCNHFHLECRGVLPPYTRCNSTWTHPTLGLAFGTTCQWMLSERSNCFCTLLCLAAVRYSMCGPKHMERLSSTAPDRFLST